MLQRNTKEAITEGKGENMIYQEIVSALKRYDYRDIRLNIPGVYMALRQEGQNGYVVVTVDETVGNTLSREQFLHIAEQIRDFLRKKDCFYSRFLYLLVSEEEESVHRLFQGQDCFWRIIPSRRCLMVFETSDQSFLELRKPLEQIFPGISNSNDRYGQQQGNENRQNNGNWQNGNRQWQGNENRQNGNRQWQGNENWQNENRQWQNNGNWQQQNNGSWQNTQRDRSNFNWNALKTQKLPWCNIIIIVVNVLVFLYTDLFAYSQNDAIVNAGALSWYAVLEQGQWYRLLTCMFLHSNLEHIFNNMLILGYVGSCLEEKIGSIRYGILYLASGILAGCASMGYNMLQNDNVVSIGASGAIFGVIGAMLFVVLARRNEEDRYTVRQIAVMAVLSLYGGLTSQGVDNAAHFGGFIAGFILAWILTMLQKRRGVS